MAEKCQISPLPGKSTGEGGEILKHLPKEEAALFQFSSESQPHVLLMVEQNKAAPNRGWHSPTCTQPPCHTQGMEKGQLKHGTPEKAALPLSAFTAVPPWPARDAPAPTRQVQSCHLSCISLAAQRRQALLMGALKSMSCVKRTGGEEGGEQSSTVECVLVPR